MDDIKVIRLCEVNTESQRTAVYEKFPDAEENGLLVFNGPVVVGYAETEEEAAIIKDRHRGDLEKVKAAKDRELASLLPQNRSEPVRLDISRLNDILDKSEDSPGAEFESTPKV